MQNVAISVRQLNLYVKSLLEGDARLSGVAVAGEISNFKNHYSSGHWYFTLKDSSAAIRCVMFQSAAKRVRFTPQDGMQVILRGRVSVYEKDGQYQMYADSMTADGVGDIALAFEQVKQKLSAEGLFDTANKRPLPKFPKRIAVITSPTGAAVQDVMNILGRRDPMCEVLLCPVAVQGDSAVPEMLQTLERVYKLGEIDIIIIGRGGGSVEDLWAFNSELLARKIYESPVPVISAVGHETDFTICDFVADLRAPTPSAAAELAVPDLADIKAKLAKNRAQLTVALNNRYNLGSARLRAVLSAATFRHPENMVFNRGQQLDRITERVGTAIKNITGEKAALLGQTAAKLDALSPLKLLTRGYAVTEKDGSVVRNVSALSAGDTVRLRFCDGSAECAVKEVKHGFEKN